MIFGTWNTQGLGGKVEDVVKALEKMRLSAKKPKSRQRGINPYQEKYTNKITSWETINERLATLNLSLKVHRIVIVAAYGPNDDATQLIKDAFYDQLNETISRAGNQRETIVMGDLNARVGSNTNSNIVGRHGENTLNNNGQRLIELCEQHKQKILNGFFQHKDIHKYTWHEETRQLKSIIDYIIVKQRSFIKVQDTRVYRGIECGSDHFFLGAKIQFPFKIKYNETDTTNISTIKQTSYNIEGLHELSTKYLFKTRLDNKLQIELLSGRTDELYKHIVSCLHSAAQEALGIKPKDMNKQNNNVTWDNTLDEQKQIKQKAFNKWLNSKDPQDKNNYRNEQSKFKSMINKNKNDTWERKCTELNTHVGGTRSSEA
ncbi:craniofacial development protein 2-like [Sitophilus oryzae]|uniref:Craniofacial development protein 2-like n=1 Tax=Sitophilus oryzae TaxID=7048 RepID=A0A6J2XF00_SITOR|nr:craniofacial development protein 2-like [Sitophilus oryzae]